MSKFQNWVLIILAGALIVLLFWWLLSEKQDGKDSEDKEIYLYSEQGELIWLELTNQQDKVKGKLHQKKVMDEIGEVPYMAEEEYTLIGEATEDGYIFEKTKDKESIELKANLTDSDISLEMPGEEGRKLLKPITSEKLTEYEEDIQQDLDYALYHMEKKEKDRIAKFVSEFTSVYGYLYSEEDKPYQLFLRIDEALLQGEVTAELLLMEKTEDENKPYNETRYPTYGITDGLMLELYTDVDGESTVLKGNFHDSAASFDLSFWLADEKLLFRAVTEEEFNQKYEEFKASALDE